MIPTAALLGGCCCKAIDLGDDNGPHTFGSDGFHLLKCRTESTDQQSVLEKFHFENSTVFFLFFVFDVALFNVPPSTRVNKVICHRP